MRRLEGRPRRLGPDGRDRPDRSSRPEDVRRGAEGLRERLGDQHQLDLRHIGRLRHVAGLPRGEGRGAHADEERRAALGDRGRPGQLGASGLHPDTDPRPGEGNRDLGCDDRDDADGTPRRAARDRGRGRLPGERRCVLRHRAWSCTSTVATSRAERRADRARRRRGMPVLSTAGRAVAIAHRDVPQACAAAREEVLR